MKKYVICGVSGRGIHMFLQPIVKTFHHCATAVGMLDPDPRRFEIACESYPELSSVACYNEQEFDKMISEQKPDVVIVAGRDSSHVDYVLAALAHDLDVICEKPMVTTAADCRRVLDAEKNSKGKVTVTFNARYPAVQRRIKELILDDKIGRITSVDLNWYIDTHHGASYFKRWNRMREHSGGLSIHKSTHHLDMVSWLIDQKPVQAFSFGDLNYYGDNGPANPSKKDGRFCGTCDEKNQCPYYTRWSSRSADAQPQDDHLGNLNSKAQDKYTDYRTDACIFDSEINIEDTYSATIKFDRGTLLSYSANFSIPYEGYRLAINGTKGRIETQSLNFRDQAKESEKLIHYYPLFGALEAISVLDSEGAHGGADPLIQEDLFLGPDPARSYNIQAGAEAGAYAVALGEAIWRSSVENRIIDIEELMS